MVGFRHTRVASTRRITVAIAVLMPVTLVWTYVSDKPLLQRHATYKHTVGFANDAFERALERSFLIAHDDNDVRARERLNRLRAYSLWHPKTNGASEVAGAWYQNNVEPSVTCTEEKRIGVLGDGGKWICNPWAIAANDRDCLVYSIGSNNHFDFEQAVFEEVSSDCEIHVFDHTVNTLQLLSKVRKPWNVYFHHYGLAAVTEGKMKSLSDIVQTLGHVGRTIDVFKVDCEGCEWSTYKSWFQARVWISQILIEVHQGTNSSIIPQSPTAKQFFTRMHEEGFRIFHKEPNTQYSGLEDLCVEFAFVRLPSSVLKS